MARTEVLSKRTPRSKTWLNDDGTYTFETGGSIAHHQKNGQWVDTDITWKNSSTELLTGEYPHVVKVNKGNLAVTVLLEGTTVPFTLAPKNFDRKAVPTYSDNRIHVPQLWTGVDLDIYLTPEGLRFTYTKTLANATNPEWTLTGTAEQYIGGGEIYHSPDGPVLVPTSVLYGIMTLDITAVPVGGVVE